MAISFYDVSVASFLQTLGGVATVLEQGAEHASANDVALDELVQARLLDDMWPLRDQVFSVAHHSLGAIQGVERGEFSPPELDPDLDYPALQQLIGNTIAALQEYDQDRVNALENNPVLFKTQRFELPFAGGADFVSSFSLPNFYFHATTAYGLLRMRGTPIGKLHYMGPLRGQS